MRRLLFISNGHGEDLIATEVIRHVRADEVVAYPLVGLGDAYPPDMPLLEPRRTFPSGGFAFRGLHGLPGDLRSGFISFWFAQRQTLARQRGRFDQVVAVGDAYCLHMASRTGAPLAHIATADSVFSARPSLLHIRLLRRAAMVFTRDEPTARFLVERGVRAICLGNVMVDCLHPQGTDFSLPGEVPVVALLPGSRVEAPRNALLLSHMADAIARARPDVRFVMALAPSVDARALNRALVDGGGTVRDGQASLGAASLVLTQAFADAITRAAVVVGLAGTANEQATGVGKPVVAFPGPGPQFTRAFLHAQRRLLGDALVAVPSPDQAAGAVLRLLASPEERARRGEAGAARMGRPGAAARIAAALAAPSAAPAPAGVEAGAG